MHASTTPFPLATLFLLACVKKKKEKKLYSYKLFCPHQQIARMKMKKNGINSYTNKKQIVADTEPLFRPLVLPLEGH